MATPLSSSDRPSKRRSIGSMSLLSRFKTVRSADDARVQPRSDTPKERHSTENAPPQAPLPQPSKPSNGPLSRSRTILKFLVTKIRPRSATAPPQPMSPLSAPPFPAAKARYNTRPPSPINTDAARERREAALRERGLLPPLKSNKDLSRRESERDRTLPVVQPLDETRVSISGSAAVEIMTPAYLIKKEWEAQNRVQEDEARERLQSFKYGASSTPVNEPQARDQPSAPLVPTPHLSVPHSPPNTALPPGLPETLERPSSPNAESPRDRNDGSEESGHLLPTLVPLPPSPPPSGSILPETSLRLEPGTPAAVPSESLEKVTALPTRERSDSWPVSSASETSLATPLQDTPQSAGGFLICSMHDIPTIVENPIEESLVPEKSILNSNLDIINEEVQDDPPQNAEQYPSLKSRRRRRTVFGDEHLTKRVTVSASLTNLRRSVTASLARAKSTVMIKGTKPTDVSHLPPSPQWRTEANSQDAPASPRPRQPVAPRLHSHGSILNETRAIKDAEARRVAELAFLS